MTFSCSQNHLNAADSRFCRICGEPLPPTQSSPKLVAGELLSWRYQVLSELGQGGFGRTYLAQDANRFNESCVLKEFAPQVEGEAALQKAEELFAREAGTLYQLQHSQIPRFRELFRAEWQGRDRLFLVQDYVEGQTYQELLQTRQQQRQSFSETEITNLLLQLLPVLDYIHTAGVIHRDISPDNLILRQTDRLPVLIDYGGVKQVAARVASISQRVAVPMVQSGAITRLGKVGYAPAEQLDHGEVHPHSDLYALAVTSLVLLSGQEPQTLFTAKGDRTRWQQSLHLSPNLTKVLTKMLDPYPSRRYQSAQEVMQALGKAIEFKPSGQPYSPSIPAFTPDPATKVVSPARAQTIPVLQAKPNTPRPAVRKQFGSVGRSLAGLALLITMIGVGWWAGVKWLAPALKSKLPEIIRSTGNQVKPPVKAIAQTRQETVFSKSEQSRKQQIQDRLDQLGINSPFLVNLVNQAFYAKHPELKGQKLGTGTADSGLRTDWDELALQCLDELQGLSAEARSRLGQYTEEDVRDRQAAAAQLNLSGRALNDLTDAQFFHWFPTVSRQGNLLNQPMGQIWQAIAVDKLNALRSGAALERIEFPSEHFSHQVSGTLKPGQSKAYLANFTQNQALRLKLQAAGSTRLSFYPPSSKASALLEDSANPNWSGKLPDTGVYEITIVSDSQDVVNYTLDLAAADEMTVNPGAVPEN
ncbi:MAG: serine/threonine protein kinase [Leptolyngbya sp.]|nr:MAG: serine/threonine protein kinase [Leptolyngbya sp.]